MVEFERALTELNALKAERAREHAAHTVEDAIRAGKIVPAQREWAIAYCAADARGFQAFAAKQPSIIGENLGLAGEPPADRRARRTQLGRTAICAQLGLKHSEFIQRKRGRADFLSLERADADHSKCGNSRRRFSKQPGLTRATRGFEVAAGAHQQG